MREYFIQKKKRASERERENVKQTLKMFVLYFNVKINTTRKETALIHIDTTLKLTVY